MPSLKLQILISNSEESLRKLSLVAIAALPSLALAQSPIVSEESKIDMSWTLHMQDFFGGAVAIDQEYLLVSAYGQNYLNDETGIVYIFDAGTGGYENRIVPIAPEDYLNFGKSIDLDSGIAVIGAPGFNIPSWDSGAAYIVDVSSRSILNSLHPSDPRDQQSFGISVGIDDGVVAVGASHLATVNMPAFGAVYLFDATTGIEIVKVLPEDVLPEERFGISVAMSGGVLVVGCPNDSDHGSESGSVYLFESATGALLTKLYASDAAAFDHFGTSVAIDGGLIVVGSHDNDDLGSRSGSAYIFHAATGDEIVKLLPGDGTAQDRFGVVVSISQGVVAVTAYDDDDRGQDSGSVYLFDAMTGAQIAKLLSSDGAANDRFGSAIAMNGDSIVVGVMNDDDYGSQSGSAYLFPVVPPSPCELADANNDGILSPADFTAWVAAFNAQGARCDQNADGLCTPADFSAWIANFNAGCN